MAFRVRNCQLPYRANRANEIQVGCAAVGCYCECKYLEAMIVVIGDDDKRGVGSYG